MESFEDSVRHSMSDSFSLYERYMRSFNVADNFVEKSVNKKPPDSEDGHANHAGVFAGTGGNIDLSAAVQINDNLDKYSSTADSNSDPFLTSAYNLRDKGSASLDLDLKAESGANFLAASSLENLNDTNEKSDTNDSKSNVKQPVFITSTMENSSNAVDSVPLFRNVVNSESVFKLPIKELSFNGTIIKHVQKLKPIVDPISALSSSIVLDNLEDKCDQQIENDQKNVAVDESAASDVSEERSNTERNVIQQRSESTGDSLYDEFNKKNLLSNEHEIIKWGDQSYSSLEASFDSGVRSPDMFSENEEDPAPQQESAWAFLKEFEAYDKRKLRKVEDRLSGIPPPPSVTTLKADVNEMLNKYYCYLPAFSSSKDNPESTSVTPTKRVSFIEIPAGVKCIEDKSVKTELNTSSSSVEKDDNVKLGTQSEALHTAWPELLKCRYYDVYYNVSCYSEKFELLSLRYGERYVGAETDTSVNIHSGGLQSPNSASKRKAMRLKLAQAKSPGRRLSHLARRRQAFCSAATIADKSQSSSKMVLIDKNFFPHKKLVNSAERKISPKFKRTPGKKTPSRKTPGKKTPSKTPKSGGSSRKKAMRRLLMEPDIIPRTQPTRETLKRALFLSPENRKSMPQAPSTSVPLQEMKSKRSLFGSPVTAETKSSDGTQSDMFLKRKRDPFDDDIMDRKSKIAKSLSFGGDSIGSLQSQPYSFSRRASETFATKSLAELNEMHKKKLLWAVTEALRVHGWRMSSPGFREKATALARLTRRLLTLPPHAARLAAPNLSTSDTMLKLARQYVFAIIQGRTVDDCFEEEQAKINSEASSKISGYISASMYQQMKAKQPNTFPSQIKENSCSSNVKQDQPRSNSKNILQDKTVNIDSNSNSGISALDRMGIFKSNSMPSFEEAAKMRARRQISFDNVDFPKR